MKIIISEKIPRIIKNKRKLEIILQVKITNRGKEITINGGAEEEFLAEKVIDALNFGFSFTNAIKIKTEENIFEIVNIKDHTKRKDMGSVRGRIIGKAGKNLKVLSQLTKCHFEIKDNSVGIIGSSENFEEGYKSIISIIQGSKHSNVYGSVKRNKKRIIPGLE